MLVALNKHGVPISLPKILSDEKTKALKREEFFCPGCKEKVLLKSGAVKIPHFAHFRDNICNVDSENESKEHIEGKLQMYSWLQLQGLNPVLEKYLPAISQRADVYFEDEKGRKFALEFQCSSLAFDSLEKRTTAYKNSGISPVWILSSSWLLQTSPHEFRISPMIWSFFQSSFLLFYSTTEQSFYILHELYPFTSQTVFATLTKKSSHILSFSQLIDLSFQTSSLHILNCWRRKRNNWKENAYRYLNPKSAFWQALYRSGIRTATLPIEIGLPVKGLQYILTPAVEWQFWIWFDCFRHRKPGERITYAFINSHFVNRIRKGNIVPRKFPLIEPNPSKALSNYLELLVIIGVMKNMDGSFEWCTGKQSPEDDAWLGKAWKQLNPK
ncbi:competence protein CoiA [Peribacillus alkalitolerans]|uniref:competence protein CoiA n=1 Tax=Peribacillus alkalitolerans TaxID=1550385 RepID=UPI0013D79D4A|nr:competence protein CoiA family protein [Peribacillus alkalitolerans]